MHLLRVSRGPRAFTPVGFWPLAGNPVADQWPTANPTPRQEKRLEVSQATAANTLRMVPLHGTTHPSHCSAVAFPLNRHQHLASRSDTVTGGDGETRTPDLLRAKQALSQLSYIPVAACRTRVTPAPMRAAPRFRRVGLPGFEPGASVLSGLRSNHLS